MVLPRRERCCDSHLDSLAVPTAPAAGVEVSEEQHWVSRGLARGRSKVELQVEVHGLWVLVVARPLYYRYISRWQSPRRLEY